MAFPTAGQVEQQLTMPPAARPSVSLVTVSTLVLSMPSPSSTAFVACLCTFLWLSIYVFVLSSAHRTSRAYAARLDAPPTPPG